ncbi:KH domain-containing protein [Patescibacteria group bacterium]|nr:KH domain-containing protein [Patescibacteria group bacterium]
MTIKEYLIKLCKHVGLTEEQFSIELEETDEITSAKLVLPEEESGLFIGYHGETLQALQRLIRVSFFDQLEKKIFKLNVNDYREQQEEQLREKVINIAQKVLETGEAYTFSFLPAHDRFLVHTILSSRENFSGLISESAGEGRDRYLTIRLKTQDEQAKK